MVRPRSHAAHVLAPSASCWLCGVRCAECAECAQCVQDACRIRAECAQNTCRMCAEMSNIERRRARQRDRGHVTVVAPMAPAVLLRPADDRTHPPCRPKTLIDADPSAPVCCTLEERRPGVASSPTLLRVPARSSVGDTSTSSLSPQPSSVCHPRHATALASFLRRTSFLARPRPTAGPQSHSRAYIASCERQHRSSDSLYHSSVDHDRGSQMNGPTSPVPYS